MPQPSIPAVLVEGFNELCDLLARRKAAQFEPAYTSHEIAELDDRISSQRVGFARRC